MEISLGELCTETTRVIDAVRAGERVTLSVRGEAVADIVPHAARTRWLAGPALRNQLVQRAADPDLRRDLDAFTGETLTDP